MYIWNVTLLVEHKYKGSVAESDKSTLKEVEVYRL